MEKIYLNSDIGKGNSIIFKTSLILMKSFMQKCLVGSAMLSEIDDYIEYWHTNETGVSLRIFLGLTEHEHEEWGKHGDAVLKEIFENCHKNMNDIDYDNMPLDEKIIMKLRKMALEK